MSKENTDTDTVNRARKLMFRDYMMQKDLNGAGNVFGGVILSIIDKVAAMRAHQFGGCWVTRAIGAMEFAEPVNVSDTVAGFVTGHAMGKTSLTLTVELEATSPHGLVPRPVATAEVTMVHILHGGKPTPHGISEEGADLG